METRNVKITIEQATTWYSSSNDALKALALSAFSRDELILYYVKTQSKTVSLDLPQGQIDKFKTLAQLSVLASYFNKITKIERGARYFLGKNNEVNHSLASTYMVNFYNEVVSNTFMYTGEFKYINENKAFNVKDLWKEK